MPRTRAEECVSTTSFNVSGCTPLPRYKLVAIGDLKPHPKNPRRHTRAQIRAIAKSYKALGYNAPILVDRDGRIVAGHGRWEAARLLGYTEVPVVFLDHLTEAKATAYMLADNKLTDRSTWDDNKIAIVLKELSDIALEFDIEATGFELPEIDFRIQSIEDPNKVEKADEFGLASGPAVTGHGDVWILGAHRISCGSALEPQTYERLLDGAAAAAAFTDPPYNVPIDGHVSGKGDITHRDFPMGVGEMSEAEFTNFLSTSLTNICSHLVPGALLYACMDWRHMAEMNAAGRTAGCDLLNLCVWAKTNAGMGSLYRSRHELVFVFRNGKDAHINNVQLGRFGRNRTNVWNYPSVDAFGRGESTLHPTIKPIGLVADAILDSTRRNDIVLDPYLGSGTTALAAERTDRRCYGIELDPLYVDTAIERWQRMTGGKAHTRLGETYDQIKSRRKAAHD
jgi:DNA modification methylase